MKKLIINWSLIASLFILFSSCSDTIDEYLDVNTNPNVPQTAEAGLLLPPIIQNMGRGIQFDSRYVGKYIQNWVQNTANDTWDRHGYISGNDASGEIWRQHYWAIGKNIDLMFDDAKRKGRPIYQGIGYAVRAWSWLILTDMYGEAILKDAWIDGLTVFNFDSQEDIYKHVLTQCDSALIYLNQASAPDPLLATADQVYKGDANKWKKFVNGILARHAIHLTNKTGFNADKIIQYCDQAFASNTDDFVIPYLGQLTDNANFYGPLRNNLTNFKQSSFIVKLLDSTSTVFKGSIDPRLPLMLVPSQDGKFRGIAPSAGESSATATAARIPNFWNFLTLPPASVKGKYLFADDAVLPIMTYAEIQFIKAEAALRKGDNVLALTAYKNGIGASIDFASAAAVKYGQTAVTTAQKNAYLNHASVSPSAVSLTMSHIMLQKYIALFGWGFVEIWSDLRKFHYGADNFNGAPVWVDFALPTSYFPDNGSKPAYRFRSRYNSEYVWNRGSLEKLGALNADYHTYEMWFTKP